MTLNGSGKCSWFGGPNDEGVSPDEGLAFIYETSDAPQLFLSYQPDGTTGLARRLNPETMYIACRWDYSKTPREQLLQEMALVRNVKTGRARKAYPADWGPHVDTDRLCDLSPGLMEALELQTDDEVEVIFPVTERGQPVATYERIVISSGHGKYVPGAVAILNEVDEARRVTNQLAENLAQRGCEVTVFHDDSSRTQSENLNTIVDFHNDQQRELDISVHFNCYVETSSPMGCEVLYVTQEGLAGQVSAAIASCGFLNRGAKKRTDLFFLNQTDMPSILIEVCFVDSSADATLYLGQFNAICEAMADVLGGSAEMEIATNGETS